MNAYELRSDGREEPRWGGSYSCQRLDGRHIPRVIATATSPEPDFTDQHGDRQGNVGTKP